MGHLGGGHGGGVRCRSSARARARRHRMGALHEVGHEQAARAGLPISRRRISIMRMRELCRPDTTIHLQRVEILWCLDYRVNRNAKLYWHHVHFQEII